MSRPHHIYNGKWDTMKTSNIIYILNFFIKENKLYLVVVFVEKIIWSLTYVFTSVYLLKILFNFMQNSVEIDRVLLLLLFTSLLCLLVYFFNVFVNQYYKPRADAVISEKIKMSIYGKYLEISLEMLESKEMQENYFFILNDIPNRFFEIIDDCSDLLSKIVAAVFILSILFTIDVFVGIAVSIFSFLLFFLNLKKNKIIYDKEISLVHINKTREYINRLFYMQKYAKEIRTSSLPKLAIEKLKISFETLSGKLDKYGKKVMFIDLSIYFIASLMFDLLILFYLTLELLIYKILTIGDYTAAINSIWRLYDNISGILSTAAKFKLHATFIEKYLNFIACSTISKQVSSPLAMDVDELLLKDITYSYDDQFKAIDSISLSIKKGDKVAIVGYNGAGKTTLIKLILGLYKPHKGEILYQGANCEKLNALDCIEKFRFISQDNNIYSLSFAENILMDEYKHNYNELYEKACCHAKLKDIIDKYKLNADSKMSTEFYGEGIQLSGGEIQRISLARLFSDDRANIFILDEPSSALDAFQESILNNILIAKQLNETVIVITHKLSITKDMDRIYFMDEGKIVESGTHVQLMKQNGKYSELYKLQLESLKII